MHCFRLLQLKLSSEWNGSEQVNASPSDQLCKWTLWTSQSVSSVHWGDNKSSSSWWQAREQQFLRQWPPRCVPTPPSAAADPFVAPFTLVLFSLSQTLGEGRRVLKLNTVNEVSEISGVIECAHPHIIVRATFSVCYTAAPLHYYHFIGYQSKQYLFAEKCFNSSDHHHHHHQQHCTHTASDAIDTLFLISSTILCISKHAATADADAAVLINCSPLVHCCRCSRWWLLSMIRKANTHT